MSRKGKIRAAHKEQRLAELVNSIPTILSCVHCGHTIAWEEMDDLFEANWLCPNCGGKFFDK